MIKQINNEILEPNLELNEILKLKDELSILKDKYIEILEENRELKNAAHAGGKSGVAKKGAGVLKRKIR